MLFCDTAAPGRGDAEDVAIFASQLAALGLAPRVAAAAMPSDPGATSSSISRRGWSTPASPGATASRCWPRTA